ncbi:Putative zn(2)Cys(6) fungal-type DNA-binding domain, fungal transcription factor [Colletotrichum destructivum]|uniref:Zn(2)Cys(6) fungal-type DNA-binding domain, fungal transcription factor n=1 Tax=Colletotrichum destructivum TaxID=34406 RepID=A0AAX4I8X4_9PEZI|nr:Putative zn(2)Cys(6) fungal-type DNA-binding domain, fungal transcription factor [Colletotrichum destructivum]
MTAPITQQQSAQAKDAAAAASVRKRRRRAPAGGAADDCFTCSKRSVKCDRRRPYCSQCLEIGNECSGYKTQLTWGVGVASRGKLRGLSLPIAKAPPVAGVAKKSPVRPRANSTATTGGWADTDNVSRRNKRDDAGFSPEHVVSTPTTPFPHSYDLLSMSHPEHTPSLTAGHWGGLPYTNSMPTDGPNYRKLGAHLGPIPISGAISSSLDSVSDADYMSPISHSYSRDDIPFLHSPNVMYDGYSTHGSPVPQSPISAILIDQRGAPTSCPSLVYAPSEHSSSLTSHMDNFESQLSQKLMRECDTLSVPEMDAYSNSCNSNSHVWTSPPPEDMSPHHSDHHQASAQWPTMFEPQAVHVNPDLIAKMPFFMDYYKNIMCPSMVFMDGPGNPYREHILHLASNSQSLQHAICALSACNLRMKRRLSLGQDTRELSEKLMAEKSTAESMADAQPEDQSLSEEYQHRNLAVHLLNQQLNDPAKSSHDSVLATILLLCHYRMVESGIAKFHTQFAGVKKILSIRRSQNLAPSRDSAWMEAIFTYFDAISASINDREAQLNSTFYGVMPDAQLLPPGAENLVGCDRELFKTISKLGRLNLLSQHRAVQNLVGGPGGRNVPSRSQSPLGSPLGHAYKGSIGGLHQQQQMGDAFNMPMRFDGNGFGSTLDDDEFASSSLCSSATYDDHRNNFWREWKEARVALQSWEFDSARVHASLPSPATPAQVRDLGSLSEAFRYAALLYTERLASPNVPSTHSNFQNLVSQVVYYATSLEAAGGQAEKFLLWPLFVAGSECVNGLQQNIVRSKCRDIMARSGYMNNLAALDVLERLWAGEWKDGEPRSPAAVKLEAMRRGPFNWTRCIGGPGVEVEWIMF